MRKTWGVVLAWGTWACGGSDPTASGDTTTAAESSTAVAETTTSTATTATESTGGADESSTGDPIEPPPVCGSLDYAWRGVLAGPGEPDFDAALADAVLRHERVHVGLTTLPSGLTTDIQIAAADEPARAAIDAFVGGDGWDFAAASGSDPRDAIATWQKATGAFAGVAAAADAYRYGTLRDQGDACEDIDRARAQLERTLEGLHLSTALTGVPGLVVRALAHRDWPGASASPTTPILDDNGDPNPLEKTNGTWREDNSGAHPEYVWEDSCSRDQLIGWVVGYAAVWEVVRDDSTIDDALKARLQDDARQLALQLKTVRPSGYDLEIWDPEGRPTLHGYLHENNLEGSYLGILNGQHAIMAAGIVAALAHVAEDPEVDAYLLELVEDRNLVGIAADSLLVDFGVATNWSNYNMAFTGAWLVSRYLDHDGAREDLRRVADRLYRWPGSPTAVVDSGQVLFDLVFAVVAADASAFDVTAGEPDAEALAQAIAGMQTFPAAPAWDFARENCDAAEIAAAVCTLADGTVVDVLGEVGHDDVLVVADAVPLAIRPPSNFYWRSNPYAPNGGGDGTAVYSGADLRFAYWLARFTRRG